MKRRNFIQALIATLFGSTITSANAVKKQLPTKVLLLQTNLAGFQYYAGEQVFNRLAANHKLTLKRDQTNRYDTNAVAVYWQNQKLGFLPRTDNVSIAQMMDRGEIIKARITQLQYSYDPWQRVELDIYWAS